MKVWFSKYEALGNDFIVVDLRVPQGGDEFSPSDFAKRYCSRNFGIGADGVLALLPPSSSEYDFQMKIFNADGSEAEMSGNGIRCLAQYVYDMQLKNSDNIVFETKAGKRVVEKTENGFKVDMGDPVVLEDFEFEGFRGVKVDAGNPHIVFFGKFSREDFLFVGSKVSKHFNTNVEFAYLISDSELNAWVWERGVGETLACGTGAAAITKSGVEKGFLPKGKMIKINFPGGELYTKFEGNRVFIEGKANYVFSGYVNI